MADAITQALTTIVIATAAILGGLVSGIGIFALMRDRSGKAVAVASDKKRIDMPVTVLTYNTHLFGGSNAEPAARLAKKPSVVFDDDRRGELIAQKLEGSKE